MLRVLRFDGLLRRGLDAALDLRPAGGVLDGGLLRLRRGLLRRHRHFGEERNAHRRLADIHRTGIAERFDLVVALREVEPAGLGLHALQFGDLALQRIARRAVADEHDGLERLHLVPGGHHIRSALHEGGRTDGNALGGLGHLFSSFCVCLRFVLLCSTALPLYISSTV